ncbi:GntR family transcriptional regulator [Roseobacter sp.]|uniref:GntR family transcriptional regulator n=1 Tax=Roseobacter sp. TaxID=1907202 RepID=UPI00385C24EE
MLDSNWDLDHDAPIGPQLHRILRERIVRNDLISGSKISEPEIAKFYAISRQPVREAFIKLSEEGLISIRPKRSTVVRKIDPVAVFDARFVREAIEADVVKLLAEASDPMVVKELRRQIEAQKSATGGNPDLFIQLDERFHRTLAESADKANAWHFVEGLKSQMDRVRFLSLSQFPKITLVEQHIDIVDGIESGNVDRSETSIRKHLNEILKDFPEIQAANPEFFEPVSEETLK